MERMSPRTATIDEVTSTAQIAIWTTSNTSRTVIRRPNRARRSRFDDLVRIGPENLAHRNNSEQNPLTNAKTKATK
jgi:hypothetical protein